jgi:hypothetical protein
MNWAWEDQLIRFTAECAENTEASENSGVDWNVLKLCALGDLRGRVNLKCDKVKLLA